MLFILLAIIRQIYRCLTAIWQRSCCLRVQSQVNWNVPILILAYVWDVAINYDRHLPQRDLHAQAQLRQTPTTAWLAHSDTTTTDTAHSVTCTPTNVKYYGWIQSTFKFSRLRKPKRAMTLTFARMLGYSFNVVRVLNVDWICPDYLTLGTERNLHAPAHQTEECLTGLPQCSASWYAAPRRRDHLQTGCPAWSDKYEQELGACCEVNTGGSTGSSTRLLRMRISHTTYAFHVRYLEHKNSNKRNKQTK